MSAFHNWRLPGIEMERDKKTISRDEERIAAHYRSRNP
jgi:hypothetical protein